MQKRKGRYFIGRIHKGGVLTSADVIAAIRNPTVVVKGKYSWTITQIHEGVVGDSSYIAGTLTKYEDHGEVAVIDDSEKIEKIMGAPGLIAARSPFVFFDNFSGFAYLHVWNAIEEDTFRRRMSELIAAKYDNFFVECEIDPISDISEFSLKVRKLKRIVYVSAKVHPPNPLFGACWANLKNYLFERRTQTLHIKEEGDKDSLGLNTRVPEVIARIESHEDLDLPVPLSLTDAALLMATDGYGKGKVVGLDTNGSEVVIHTSETQKSFLFNKEPNVQLFAEEAFRQLEIISNERKMVHA